MKKKPSEVVARLHNRPEGNANATVLCRIETSKTLINTERHTFSETHAHTHTEDTWGIVQWAAPSIEVVTVTVTVNVTVTVTLEDHLSPLGTIWSCHS